MKADLHVHTSITDGSFSQEDVIKYAYAAGINHLAITDHDTTEGLEEAINLGSIYNVKVIPGIEISAYDYDNNKKCHIVGLYVPINDERLNSFIFNTNNTRRLNLIEQLKRLQKNNYDISIEDFNNRKNRHIFKQHVMEILIKKGYAKSFYGPKYIELFKGKGICNMKVDYPSAIESVTVLREVGAFPVLAHPGVYNNFDIINKLADAGLMGIESVYPMCTESDYNRINDIAKKFDLVKTGGSDFHGRYSANPNEKLGDYFVSSNVIGEIKNRLIKK